MTLRQNLPTTDLATTFAALGDQRRLAIISKLQDADGLSITALCEGMGVSRQAVRKHLGVLADARLVSVEKLGRERRYCLEPERLEEANSYLSAVGTKWDQALVRLKNHLE